jgi:hypothetical protein
VVGAVEPSDARWQQPPIRWRRAPRLRVRHERLFGNLAAGFDEKGRGRAEHVSRAPPRPPSTALGARPPVSMPSSSALGHISDPIRREEVVGTKGRGGLTRRREGARDGRRRQRQFRGRRRWAAVGQGGSSGAPLALPLLDLPRARRSLGGRSRP